MFWSRSIQLLLVALSFLSIAQAVMFEAHMIRKDGPGLARRQRTATGPTGAATTSPRTSSTPPSTSDTPTSTPTSTPPPPTSSTPTPPTSSNPPSSTPTSPSDTPSNTPTPTPSTSTFIVTTTASDGSPTSYTSQSVSIPTPSLTSQNGGGNTGMSETTRNTIIGVVVGIGGAIILGVLAFVAWRVWGRKKQAEENDDLMGYGGPSEKTDPASSTSGRSPFQSTLESYHAPTSVNTASNF